MSSTNILYSLSFHVKGVEQTINVSNPDVVIGRSPSSDVVIPEERVSRQHAKIYQQSEAWILADLGSANGTFLNGKPVVKSALRDGDQITFGELPTLFTLPDSATSSLSNRVILDEEDRKGKTAIFNMAELNLDSSITPAKAAEPKGAAAAAAWAMGLFNQAAQCLASTDGLDDVLGKVMDLVFNNLAVDSGVIALYSEEAGIEPRVTRSRRAGVELRISQSIAMEAITKKQAILVSDISDDKRWGAEQSILAMNIASAMCAPLYNEGRICGLLYVDNRDRHSPFNEENLRLLSTLGVFAAVAVEQTRLRDTLKDEERIRSRLEQYNSPAVVDRIVKGAMSGTHDVRGSMIAEERVVSVIFSDLSGFTSMSEKMAPQEVAQLLNNVFERLTDVIFHFEGTLDKFMGDGMMAFFGAPLDQPDHAERAVRSGLRMQEALAEFNRELKGEIEITMRVGVNTGPVTAGDIGSPRRRDYTVIGDTVNIASRLESSVSKANQVVVGPATMEAVKDIFNCESLGGMELKGKAKKVESYLVTRR